MVVRVSTTFILVSCRLGGVASDAIAGYDANGTVGGGRGLLCSEDCYTVAEIGNARSRILTLSFTNKQTDRQTNS